MIKLASSMILKRKDVFIGSAIASILSSSLLTISGTLLQVSINGMITRNGGYSGTDYASALSIFGTMSVMTVFATLFVLMGTVTFSVQQRYRDFALLRGIGLLPRQINQLLSMEAFFLSATGFLIGAPLGIILTPPVLNRFISLGAISRSFELSFSPFVLLIVYISGFVSLLAASGKAGNKITRLSPVEAMGADAIKRKDCKAGSLVTGLLLTGGGAAILLTVPMTGAEGIGYNFLASICFIIGLSALATVIIKIVTITGSLLSGKGLTTLTLANLNQSAEKMIWAVGAIILLITLNGGILINTTYFNERFIADQSNLAAQNAVLYSMVLISTLFSLIGVGNTFAITISSRLEEFRKYRQIGMTSGQIIHMANKENRILTAIGAMAGAVSVSLCVAVFTKAQSGTPQIIGAPHLYFGLIGIAVLTSLILSSAVAKKTVKKAFSSEWKE